MSGTDGQQRQHIGKAPQCQATSPVTVVNAVMSEQRAPSSRLLKASRLPLKSADKRQAHVKTMLHRKLQALGEETIQSNNSGY